MTLCSECPENPYLRSRIASSGDQGGCLVCRKQMPHVFQMGQLAEMFREAIRGHFDVDYDHFSNQPNDVDLRSVVEQLMGQDVVFFEDLISEIVDGDAEPVDRRGNPFYGTDVRYQRMERLGAADQFTHRWSKLVGDLKHRRRFFSDEVQAFFREIFKNIETMTAWEGHVFSHECPVVQRMEAGTVVYRARVVAESDDVNSVLDDPFKQVGPPPRNRASAARMSPQGVVALYCAMESETALAELRPAIGGVSAIIELALSRPLRLLNFHRLERSLGEGWGALLDIGYSERESTRQFLRMLHHLISLPVVPGNEADYLITQTMAEYLAHVHEPRIDGIVFSSVQYKDGLNIVMFAEHLPNDPESDSFPVIYVADSLRFVKTSTVRYVHADLDVPNKIKAGRKLYTREERASAVLRYFMAMVERTK